MFGEGPALITEEVGLVHGHRAADALLAQRGADGGRADLAHRMDEQQPLAVAAAAAQMVGGAGTQEAVFAQHGDEGPFAEAAQPPAEATAAAAGRSGYMR